MSDIPDNGAFSLGLANINSANFGPTATANQANTNANTQNLQAATQGQQIANQNAALNLQALKVGLSQLYKMPGFQVDDQSGTASASSGTSSRGGAPAPSDDAPSSSASSSGPATAPSRSAAPASAQGDQPSEDDEVGTSVVQPEHLDAALRNTFFVNPLGTPEEQNSIMAAARVSALTKNPAYVQIATQQRDMAVAQRKLQAQQYANKHYSELSAVADAGDKGNAFDVLAAVAPESAAIIEKMHPKEAGESDVDYKTRLNDVAADSAAHYAGHVFQYTGRETETRKDGVVVDKATGFPVAGVRGSGMSPQEYSEAIDKANAPVTIKNSDGSESQVPMWKYAKSQGAPVSSAADYVKQKADAQQAIAQHKQTVQDIVTARRAQQPQSGAPSAPQAGAASPQPSAPQPGVTPPGASPQSGQQPVQQQPQSAPPPGDPQVLKQALTDPEYKLKTPPVIAGRSQTPGDAEQQKANVAVRQSILKDSSDLTSTSSQAKAYTDAALAVLNSPDKPPTGLSAQTKVAISRAMQAMGISSGDWATQSQELAKYMGNLAVQNFKANFGAHASTKEFGVQMTELNPNAKMTPDAIRDLLQSNSRIAQYNLDSSRRAGLYINQGGDPNRFVEWNERYFPRTAAVNPQTPPTRPGQSSGGGGGQQGGAQRTIVRTGTMNGRKVVQYSDGTTGYAE